MGYVDTAKSSAAASNEVAVAVMRIGFGLMAAATASDVLFAGLASAGVPTMIVGVLFTGCAVYGLVRPDSVAGLLRRRGRALVPAALFAVAGALDPGVPGHYAEVASAIVWITAITSSTGWVALCVAVSGGGYVADLALQGHSLDWMVNGAGRDLVANQSVDLVANAGVMLLMIALLRRFVAAAPQSIAEVRGGGASLTPQLALAASGQRLALPRADSRALAERFTPSERRVVALLAEGRTPKLVA